ncbi:hypothetical protein EYZ11_006551 [Aspergillus tanneri]|uniref:CCCH zinc finger and RRM domain-containing protein n=1 Tax=Aspergillus tanneri TaxID=1220188 RepID=A0A4V3UP77_9EURO|nr:uncharacterized protein ATNIH1004_008320 [Aspergillus tanneri]KAA8644122.1 hypothetical protein ATNIH1004_008320 [Aspergillus tanneri]THC93974.1 hypothetical protein EYZ11_006551 [Aspergillus tanneri]
MQLSEVQAEEVKKWVIRKLEDISDADSDVLADYVLALIRTDAPDEDIRKASEENLEDFLREHTAQFVNELFTTFASKTPSAPQVQPPLPHDMPSIAATSTQSVQFNPPSGPPRGTYGPQVDNISQSQSDGPSFNRKRSYHEGFHADQERDDFPHNRTFKTPRRGRGGGRGDWMGRDSRTTSGVPGLFPPTAGGFPVMPPAFPAFDQNDPMAAMIALQGMGFPQMPGMPPIPMPPGAPGQQPEQMVPKTSERCPFYETQGICYLGAACPYQHDSMPGISKEDEYDPKSSNIVTDFQRRNTDSSFRGGDRGRGRGRGDRGGFGGRGRRSELSAAGPNDDTSITTIVVEQIPDDKLDDATIREFFSQYGEIVEVSLQPHRRLALITYDSHAAAKRAWSSPKVIFDNRFVKVYWHKPKTERNNESRPAHVEASAEEPVFDQEEFEKQQEEAQKAHDEKMRKRKETEHAKQALEKQREELLKKQEEEKDRLMRRLGAKNVSNGAKPESDEIQSTSEDNTSDQTKQLRAQLAALEAEAKTLGIDPSSSDSTSSFGYRGRGRGAFGRGGYPPRGRGYDPSYRGGRGRGGMARGRGGVLRLDNRPKRIAVSGVDFNNEKDEALRQFLIGIGEYESIEPHPEESSSLIVAFKERYVAEKFMFGSWKIPSVGEVQLTWVPNPPISTLSTTSGPGSETKATPDEDTMMDSTTSPPAQSTKQKDGNNNHEVDYDVAEVDDNWGVE